MPTNIMLAPTFSIILLLQLQLCYVSTFTPPTQNTEISSVCPDGYTHFPEKHVCFRLVSNIRIDWHLAHWTCQLDGGRLAVLNNQQSNTFLRQLIPKHISESNSQYWIGANDLDVSNWKWVDGSDFRDYDDWLQNEPNGCNEHCVELQEGGWNDNICQTENYYICERPDGYSNKCLRPLDFVLRNEHCYWASLEDMSNVDAHSFCDNDQLLWEFNQVLFDYIKAGYFDSLRTSGTIWFQSALNQSQQYSGITINLEETSWEEIQLNNNVSQNASVVCQKSINIYPIFSCPLYYMVVTDPNNTHYSCIRTEYNDWVTWHIAVRRCQDNNSLLVGSESETIITRIAENYIPPHRTFWASPTQCYSFNAINHECLESENLYVCQHKGYFTFRLNTRELFAALQDRLENLVIKPNTRLRPPPGVYHNHLATSGVANLWKLDLTQTDIEKLFELSKVDCPSQSNVNFDDGCCDEIYLSLRNTRIYGNSHEHWCLIPAPIMETFTQTTVTVLKTLTSENEEGVKPTKLCPCSCDAPKFDPNPSPQMLAKMLFKIQRELTVDRSSVSLIKMKKQSANDERVESATIGCTGIAFCLIELFALVALDVATAIRKSRGAL